MAAKEVKRAAEDSADSDDSMKGDLPSFSAEESGAGPSLSDTGPSPLAADSATRIVLLGSTGSGKSSSGNTIMGQKLFKSPKRYKEKVTKTCEEQICQVSGRKVCVIDTPDLLDPNLTEDHLQREKDELVRLCQPGLHAVLLVVPVGNDLENEEDMLEFTERLFGPNIQNFIMVLFTHGDQLEDDETLESLIEGEEELQQLVKRCGNRFHGFNNTSGHKAQVIELLEKIDFLVTSNGRPFCMAQQGGAVRDMTWGPECPERIERPEQRRLVLLGKTGAGKSATGNTILGKKVFASESSSTSQTRECSSAKTERSGKEITVIDTPGLFDTRDQYNVMKEIFKCLTYASPGPHAFLIVLRVGRFTPEEKDTVKQLKEVFGENAEKYTMFLFTHKDQLEHEKKTIQQYIETGDPELRSLIESCGNRFYCMDNNSSRSAQFKEFIGAIESMVAKNQGMFFSDETFSGVEQSIVKIQNEKLEEKLKHYTEKQKQQSEWEKIYWRLLEESRSEAKEILISDRYVLLFAKCLGKINVSREEKENAIKTAESKGVSRTQALSVAFKATVKLARQNMCGVQ